MEPQADIALIGLAVMGQNLVLNMDDHGFTVVVYNRTVEKVDRFLENEAKGTKVISITTEYSSTASKSDEIVVIRPGTDPALALGALSRTSRSPVNSSLVIFPNASSGSRVAC